MESETHLGCSGTVSGMLLHMVIVSGCVAFVSNYHTPAYLGCSQKAWRASQWGRETPGCLRQTWFGVTNEATLAAMWSSTRTTWPWHQLIMLYDNRCYLHRARAAV